ncbi:MAG TPA: RT0821/Lpp0805 family surface protein [Woeseiaceae bacterium]|nr:RT0821/Lpp0805 family surface protein [Woeseiaceae bacterium]
MIEINCRTKTYHLLGIALSGALVLASGCASQDDEPVLDESQAGQIIGGVAGAAAGSQVGGGSGQTVATIAGALVGAVVGERIGARMEEDDRRAAAQVLEENRTGETSSWENPDTGHEFAVTPVDTFERAGRPCREFEFRVETDRGSEVEERTACRNNDGTWEVMG